jgi:hypothetical protein
MKVRAVSILEQVKRHVQHATNCGNHRKEIHIVDLGEGGCLHGCRIIQERSHQAALAQTQGNMHHSEACTRAIKTPREKEKLESEQGESTFANSQDEEKAR